MKIFVTGATGVLGRAVVERLRRRGDEIVALSHSEAAAARLKEVGLATRSADLIGRDDLTKTVSGCDAILHLATRIPAGANMMKMAAWRENDRIRQAGCERLAHAAKGAGIRTIVFPSIALVYPDGGADWIDAQSTRPPVTAFMRATLNAERSIERFGDEGGRGIVLRMGQFYGQDRMTQDMMQMAEKGWMLFFGPEDAYLSWVFIDDAADAVVAALNPTVASGIYDVVDDEPTTRAEIFSAFATLKRRKIRKIPTWPFRIMGGEIARMLSGSRRVRNRRFKDAAGWTPSVPSFKDGLRRIATTKPAR